MAASLGVNFEREIREQPDVWERIAAGGQAEHLAASLDDDIVLVGSGSSLFVAELGALAFRRRRIRAQALAATEARLDHSAYEGRTVVAISQSGGSTDLLAALDVLSPQRLIALTNTIDSPLAARADVIIDVGAGREVAVPASKSVTATAALLLHAASIAGGDESRNARALADTSAAVRAWMNGPQAGDVTLAAERIAQCHSVAVLGSDYGWPVAREAALKIKEASYLHAEGFAAGEFRHGSIAMIDASSAVLGIVDRDALPAVAAPMREIRKSEALRYIIGTENIDDIPQLGPAVDDPYNTLAWLVTAQLLALHAARARHVDSDAPRAIAKALIERR
ncbi:MAG TPA: SIS domain-containing protein [Candidatus Eremiobacteraceae bacterium]|nr:SIS domain-containing protein [Candidatus Eremiobacteraceae bacterium]